MKYTVDDIREAWNKYNSIGPLTKDDSPIRFKMRDQAWKEYTYVRDTYLYDIGNINQHQVRHFWTFDTPTEPNQ